jgi:Bacterial PH domain
VAALDAPANPPPAQFWRTSARRRVTVLALTLLAAGLGIAVVGTEPPGPVSYDMRLPLLILAGGALVNAVQWRRRVCITPDEVVLRTLIRTRRIPLPAIDRAETDDGRVTIRMLSGRKAVVRAITDPSAADDFVNALVTAAGPAACRVVGAPSVPVPMATPWLIMTSTVGVAVLAAKGFAADPAPVIAALGTGTVTLCAAWAIRGSSRAGSVSANPEG